MRDVAEIVVPWVVVTLGLFALLDWDESRLSPSALEEAWPPATRTLAVAYFGLIAMPIHFWRTRFRRLVQPLRYWAARRGLGAPRVVLEVLLWVVLWIPAAGLVAFVVDWLMAEVLEALPEWSLGWVIGASLSGFTVAMVWRSRKGGWYHSARGH